MSTATPPPARRSFLALLTGAAVAPAAAALPAVVIAAQAPPPPVVEEVPELLAFDGELTRLRADLDEAIRLQREAIATYERLRPEVPQEIIIPLSMRLYVTGHWDSGEDEIDISGRPAHGFRRLFNSRKVKARIILDNISRNTKNGKRLRKIARLAAAYEKADEAARRSSRYQDSELRLKEVAVSIGNTIDRIIATAPPRTLAGVMIYAKAASINADVYEAIDGLKPFIGELAISALVRINGGAA